MRPVRVEVEGFSAYRDLVEVDFEGVDFFSLAGPTGSGKSSLIDAMIFALYGRVPRLGGNAVAPAISAGADRARVRLDFEVGGTVYTAARLAARTPSGGATVKEARLQDGDVVLADGADNVTSAVESLLRLRYDDFTRTVVLPQGDFARFLTATKAERQGLLRNLLGLDVYTTMRELAHTRGAVASDRAESALRALETLDIPDEITARAALDRRDTLADLSDTITEREKQLAAFDHDVVSARQEAEKISNSVERLRSITPPDRLEELDSMIIAARAGLEDAEEAVEIARKSALEMEASLADLPSIAQLTSWTRTREKLGELDVRLDEEPLLDARLMLDEKLGLLAGAKAGLDEARDGLASARGEHAAHELASALMVGEPCPVCSNVVEELPQPRVLPELVDLQDDVERHSDRLASLQEGVDGARSTVATLESVHEELRKQRESLEAELTDAPGPDAAAELEDEIERVTKDLQVVREELAGREKAAKDARARLEDLAETSRRIGRKLTEAQLSLAGAELDPPLSESDDVIVQWKELLVWRSDRLDELGPRLEAARTGIGAAEAVAETARNELIALLQSHEIPVLEPFAVQVATALQTARSTVEAHEKARADSIELAEKAKRAQTDADVATALANHLRANGFEQWLMVGALTELVDGANELLGQLSGGGYSLHSDGSGTFSIVDHRNADEMRSVSTLSGGETFLVSLALALSLAETLAAKGGSGLDAIILDEGFGTLDDESLDIVASVLEELTGRGLMVGVITHVKELAARAPMRYEVVREPAGARVKVVS